MLDSIDRKALNSRPVHRMSSDLDAARVRLVDHGLEFHLVEGRKGGLQESRSDVDHPGPNLVIYVESQFIVQARFGVSAIPA